MATSAMLKFRRIGSDKNDSNLYIDETSVNLEESDPTKTIDRAQLMESIMAVSPFQ